jgi:hypothetical protein
MLKWPREGGAASDTSDYRPIIGRERAKSSSPLVEKTRDPTHPDGFQCGNIDSS